MCPPLSVMARNYGKSRSSPSNTWVVTVVGKQNKVPKKRLTNTPTTLNERFTQLTSKGQQKTQRRDAQVQRNTTNRHAVMMAKRTGQSKTQFMVRFRS